MKSLTVSAEGNPLGVKVTDALNNKASVVQTDYFTSNGVIHVVDKLLLPQ
jgi:uncharacterized surface protein with fasciclin (FAS1) repeats